MARSPWMGLLVVAALALGCDQASNSVSSTAVPAEGAQAAGTEASAVAASDEIALITIDGYGEIRLRFFPDKAPKHVENFKKLARSGFYDGVTIHRIIPGFMIQGGDPKTKDDDPSNDGTGGPGYSIKAEFNDVPHTRGTLSMARASHPDSAGSQFFIVVKDSNFLDGKYTVFGEVASGMDIADQIVKQPRDKRDRPLEPIVVKSVAIVPAEDAA